MSPRFFAGFVTYFTSELEPLLEEIIMCERCTLGPSFTGRSHLADEVVEFLASYMEYRFFNSSRHGLNVDPFTVMTIVWFHASTSTPIGPSIPVILYLQS